jgi:hypothetical protein
LSLRELSWQAGIQAQHQDKGYCEKYTTSEVESSQIAPDIRHNLLLQENGVTRRFPAAVLPLEPHAHTHPTTKPISACDSSYLSSLSVSPPSLTTRGALRAAGAKNAWAMARLKSATKNAKAFMVVSLPVTFEGGREVRER